MIQLILYICGALGVAACGVVVYALTRDDAYGRDERFATSIGAPPLRPESRAQPKGTAAAAARVREAALTSIPLAEMLFGDGTADRPQVLVGQAWEDVDLCGHATCLHPAGGRWRTSPADFARRYDDGLAQIVSGDFTLRAGRGTGAIPTPA